MRRGHEGGNQPSLLLLPPGPPAEPRPLPGHNPAPQGGARRALIYGPSWHVGAGQAFLSSCQEALSQLCRKPGAEPASTLGLPKPRCLTGSRR